MAYSMATASLSGDLQRRFTCQRRHAYAIPSRTEDGKAGVVRNGHLPARQQLTGR